MPLTVKQLKEREPLLDVTELKDGVRYIIRCKSHISEVRRVQMSKMLREAGLNVVLIVGPDIELFEIVE